MSRKPKAPRKRKPQGIPAPSVRPDLPKHQRRAIRHTSKAWVK